MSASPYNILRLYLIWFDETASFMHASVRKSLSVMLSEINDKMYFVECLGRLFCSVAITPCIGTKLKCYRIVYCTVANDPFLKQKTILKLFESQVYRAHREMVVKSGRRLHDIQD